MRSLISYAKTLKVKCPVCCAESFTLLFKFGTSLFPINVSICNQCGFVFQNPRVSEQDWNNYYEIGIYDKFHRPRSMKSENLVNTMGVLTYNRVWDFISHSTDVHHNSAVDSNKTGNKINICEVGAGSGDIITSFKGANLYAIEPSENCREILKKKGVSVLGKSINSINENVNIIFDIILMRHVLEHIYYPKKLFDDIIPLLSGDGILYIAIPNILNPNYIRSFTYPHISYFSKYSLTYLCWCAGFEVCKIQEEKDEIWCILKKIRMSKKESLQDNKNLWGKNIEWTRRVFQTYKNNPQLIKRSVVRIISNIIPLGLLIDIYERRSKKAGG